MPDQGQGQSPGIPGTMVPLEDLLVDTGKRSRLAIARCRVDFLRSTKPANTGLDFSYAKKPQVQLDGQSLFPELAILGLFRKEGWSGVWADAARRKFFTIMPNTSKGVTLDTWVSQALSRIARGGVQGLAGCWDLILWRRKTLLFVETSGVPSGERLGKAHLAWLDAALRSGMGPGQFLVVEWDYRNVVVRRKPARPDPIPSRTR